jgi:sucrose-6-phosphate hydrolase SacC (GH32 family)
MRRPARGSWSVASRNNTDRDHATYGLFRSSDLTAWTLVQESSRAWYWECPDMFELRDGEPGPTRWLLVKGSGDYIVGAL